MTNRRIDPALDKRRLIVFFAGLIVFYVGVLLTTQPVLNGGEAELDKFVIGVMLAPTIGAALACVFGPGVIRFGMPSWWLLAAFLPAVLVFLITLVAAPVSRGVTFHPDQVGGLLLMAVVQSLLLCIFALGEEIGWRGFLWPLMRRRLTFLASTAIMCGIWWIYHARTHLRWMVRIQRWHPGVFGGAARFRVVRRRADRAVAVDLAEGAGPRLVERVGRDVLLLVRCRGGSGFYREPASAR
jgi:membrane protease YdiL (CAAX protease family)